MLFQRIITPLNKHFLLWIIATFTCFQTSGQNIIRGTVSDRQTGEPLDHASIRIQDTGQGVFSDESGSFQISTELDFPIKLIITHLGYKPMQISINVSSQPLEISLVKSVLFIDEVVISASRKQEKVTEAPASISILDANKIQADVVTNPILSLRNLPGVEIQDQGLGFYNLTLRGRQSPFPVEGLVLVDNRQLVLPGFVNAPFSLGAIESIDLERVEVIHGPSSALYGPGVEGGVVHFLTKDPFRYPGTTIKVYGGEQASFGSSIRHARKINEKWAYKILAIYKRADNWPLSSEDSAFVGNFPNRVISALNLIRCGNWLYF